MIGRIHNKAHCTKLNLHVRKKVRNWKIVKTKVNRWYLVVTHWGSAGHRGSLLAGRRKERIVTYSNTSLQTGKRSNDLADIYYLLVENCLHCLFRIEPRLRGDWGETDVLLHNPEYSSLQKQHGGCARRWEDFRLIYFLMSSFLKATMFLMVNWLDSFGFILKIMSYVSFFVENGRTVVALSLIIMSTQFCNYFPFLVDICRVCRAEGTQDRPLYHPCICTGSIKFIHQDW